MIDTENVFEGLSKLEEIASIREQITDLCKKLPINQLSIVMTDVVDIIRNILKSDGYNDSHFETIIKASGKNGSYELKISSEKDST